MQLLNIIDETFRELTSSLNDHGVDRRQFNFLESQSLQYAKNNLEKDLFEINEKLQIYNTIIKDEITPFENEKHPHGRHLNIFLNKFNLSVTNKIFNDLTNDTIIEVYTNDHQQIYRSVNFFSLSSYDLGTLTFMPWNKLFHRSDIHTQAMFKNIDLLINSNLDYTIPDVSPHFLTEIKTGNKFRYNLLRTARIFDVETEASMGYLSLISVKKNETKLKILH